MKIRLNDVRLAFANIWVATSVKGNKGDGDGANTPSFSASFILGPNHKDLATIRKAVAEVAKEKWPKDADKVVTALTKQDKICLHDGDTKSQYEGFEGNLYVSARNKSRPFIIDGQKKPLVQADGKPYAGCFVNAVLDVWAQDNGWGKRINASLLGVQFLRDGDAFSGGGTASADDFEEVTENSEVDPLG